MTGFTTERSKSHLNTHKFTRNIKPASQNHFPLPPSALHNRCLYYKECSQSPGSRLLISTDANSFGDNCARYHNVLMMPLWIRGARNPRGFNALITRKGTQPGTKTATRTHLHIPRLSIPLINPLQSSMQRTEH